MSKYLVISGGSHCIGQATIRRFLQEDWQVVNISLSSCQIAGVTDITVDFSLAGWSSQYVEDFLGAVHGAEQICLVHHAADCFSDTVQDMVAADLRNAFEVNVIAPVHLNQIFLPVMQAGSSVVYIGSMASEIAAPGLASYATTKHALAGLMKATCQDVREQGVHTCCICPGFTNTKNLLETLGHDGDALRQLQSRVTANRLVEPEEIAELAWFSANNPIVNGSMLHANLGLAQD